MTYGDKRDYPKIDVYVRGDYRASTTWARTCRAAKARFLERHPNLQPGDVRCYFAKGRR